MTLPASARLKPRRIGILAYEGCMGTEIFGVADVLRIAGHIARALGDAGPAPFDVQVIGVTGGPVHIAGGHTLLAKRASGRFDLLVVPGLDIAGRDEWDKKLAPLVRELAFIRRSFARGTPVAAVCVGTFLLGEAGLLDGRRVTTAWLFTRALASRYGAARVDPDAVLVEDGAVITTGAVSSTFDLALHIVKQTLGAKLATATARIALLPGPRASQAPYVDAALIEPSLPSFSQSVALWLSQRLAAPYDLERLALTFRVSARTLLRRVKAQTNQSPLTLLQHARVEKAKRLLTGTTRSLARITEDVGYSDVATFSRLFARRVGETPARYRRR